MKTKTDTNQYSRKQFLKSAGSTALFATLGIGLYGCGDNSMDAMDSEPPINPGSSAITISDNGNKIIIDLNDDSVSGLGSEGGWLLITQANTLVVNVGDNVIRAFTSFCTHARCSRDWGFRNGVFECLESGCGHGSRFDTNGKVVKGPATRDLTEFTVVTENNSVTITK
ncbi:MAG: Rieske (2Fe-2S) protein [Candidatus Paceibacterota bacterium]